MDLMKPQPSTPEPKAPADSEQFEEILFGLGEPVADEPRAATSGEDMSVEEWAGHVLWEFLDRHKAEWQGTTDEQIPAYWGELLPEVAKLLAATEAEGGPHLLSPDQLHEMAEEYPGKTSHWLQMEAALGEIVGVVGCRLSREHLEALHAKHEQEEAARLEAWEETPEEE